MLLEDVLLCLLLAQAVLLVSCDHEHVFKALILCIILGLHPHLLLYLHVVK